MFNKTTALTCFNKLVGFRSDSNAVYATLYNQVTATVTNTLTFAALTKTITGAGTINFLTEDFATGDSLIVTGSASNNGTFTILTVTANIITVTEVLVDEASAVALIKALSDIQKSTSGLWVNALPSVSYEYINANITPDLTAKQYLQNVTNDCIIDILNQFVSRSKQDFNSKELLAKQDIASGVAPMTQTVTQNQRFVGWWLHVHESNYLKVQLTHIGMQATAIQATALKIYLYETSQLEPIATFDFTMDTVLSLVWKEVTDFLLYYQNETAGTGQDFLLGYYEADVANPQSYQLQNQALYMDFLGCRGCGVSPPNKIYKKYLDINPIEISNGDLNFNVAADEYYIPLVDNVADFVTDQTYGLLAKINVTCDITEVLCYNKDIFAKALQHAIAVKILYDAYASNKINSVSDSKRDQVKQFAVKYDGILNGYTGEGGVFVKGLLQTLTVDFSALDSHCLPCKPGIKVGGLVR